MTRADHSDLTLGMLGSRHALIAKNRKFRNSLWIVKRQLGWNFCRLLVPTPPRGTRLSYYSYYSSRARVVLFYWSHLKHGSNTEKWLIFTSGLTKLLPYSWIHERLLSQSVEVNSRNANNQINADLRIFSSWFYQKQCDLISFKIPLLS